MKTKSLLCAALAATSALLVSAVQAKQLKVLMIGNSFSICVLKEMPACAASAGETLDLASLYIGGCPLDRHWENVEKAGDPNFKPYGFSYNYASVKDPKEAPVAKLAPTSGTSSRSSRPARRVRSPRPTSPTRTT